MFYYHMILLTLCAVYVVGVSGFVEDIKKRYAATLKLSPDARISCKPFDCCTCMTFWSGVVLCCFEGVTLEHAAFVCVCAFLAHFVENCYFLIREFLAALVRLLTDKIEKL